MTHDSNPRPYGQMALALALIAGGVACLAITVAANVDMGWSLGTTEWSRTVFAASAFAVDVVGVSLFACVVGVLYRARRMIAALAMAAVVTVACSYSLANWYGFSAAHRMVQAERADKTHRAEAAALAKSETLTRSMRDEHIDFLRAEVSRLGDLARTRNKERRAGVIAEKQVALDALGQASFGEVEIKAEPIAVSADPQAAAIARDTGLSEHEVQRLLILALGGILIAAKALSFGFGFALWPRRPELSVAMTPQTETVAEAEPPAAIEMRAANDVDDDETERQVGVAVARDLRAYEETDDHVVAFVETATRPASAACLPNQQVYEEYVRWCQGDKIVPLTTSNFGVTMRDLYAAGRIDWRKVEGKQRRVHYVGRALNYGQGVEGGTPAQRMAA